MWVGQEKSIPHIPVTPNTKYPPGGRMHVYINLCSHIGIGSYHDRVIMSTNLCNPSKVACIDVRCNNQSHLQDNKRDWNRRYRYPILWVLKNVGVPYNRVIAVRLHSGYGHKYAQTPGQGSRWLALNVYVGESGSVLQRMDPKTSSTWALNSIQE